MTLLKIMYLSSLLVAIPWMVNAVPHQQPLTGDYLESSSSIISPNFKRVPQNDTLCNAGSAQWTGTVRVGKDRDIFYWYFESRHDPENAPLILWMNGGPGGSSMLGALFEIGACSVTDDGSSTTRNKNSWNEFANVVFIDQPVGVGLSETKDSKLWAKDLGEASIDFSRFLDVFVEEAFPELESRPIHVAGESFAGKYVPAYVSVLRRKLASIILVDPFIDWNLLVLGVYEHMCVPAPIERNGRQFNATACEEMEKAYSSCDKAASLCDLTYDAGTCLAAMETCNAIYERFYDGVVEGGWDPYDDRRACENPPLCGGQGMDEVKEYLNSDFARQALGLQDKVDYKPVNFEFNEMWANQSETWIPTSREIAKILDIKETPVLVINGMNDIGINWQGIAKILNSIQWSGQARFKAQLLKSWSLYDESGTKFGEGTYKWYDRLALFNVDEAGHMSPHDQPRAVSWAMKKWVSEETLEGL